MATPIPPFLSEAARRLGPSGWPVDLALGHDGPRLVAWPWGREGRSLALWELPGRACARLERTDRVAPARDYLDPVRRERMVRSLLGMITEPDEGLAGFAAGHLARLLGEDDAARWDAIGREAERLHRAAVAAAGDDLPAGRLLVGEDGWVSAEVELPLPAEGLDDPTFDALLAGVLDVEARYQAHLRAALLGGFGLARHAAREDEAR